MTFKELDAKMRVYEAGEWKMHTATVSIHGAIGPVTTQLQAKTYLQPVAKYLLIMIYPKDSYRFNTKVFLPTNQ